MKWRVSYTSGPNETLSAPNMAAARKLAEEHARKYHLHGDIESIEPDEGNASRGVSYVVMGPWGSQVVFRGGLSRCVEYVMKNSGGWIGAIRARSSTDKLRNLTPVEQDRAIKLSRR